MQFSWYVDLDQVDRLFSVLLQLRNNPIRIRIKFVQQNDLEILILGWGIKRLNSENIIELFLLEGLIFVYLSVINII